MNEVFRRLCAKDGRDAWDLLAKPNAPRLDLLDWMLAEVDGVELCRRLRRRPDTEPYTYTIHDYLTKLWNRAAIIAFLQRGWRGFSRGASHQQITRCSRAGQYSRIEAQFSSYSTRVSTRTSALSSIESSRYIPSLTAMLFGTDRATVAPARSPAIGSPVSLA